MIKPKRFYKNSFFLFIFLWQFVVLYSQVEFSTKEITCLTQKGYNMKEVTRLGEKYGKFDEQIYIDKWECDDPEGIPGEFALEIAKEHMNFVTWTEQDRKRAMGENTERLGEVATSEVKAVKQKEELISLASAYALLAPEHAINGTESAETLKMKNNVSKTGKMQSTVKNQEKNGIDYWTEINYNIDEITLQENTGQIEGKYNLYEGDLITLEWKGEKPNKGYSVYHNKATSTIKTPFLSKQIAITETGYYEFRVRGGFNKAFGDLVIKRKNSNPEILKKPNRNNWVYFYWTDKARKTIYNKSTEQGHWYKLLSKEELSLFSIDKFELAYDSKKNRRDFLFDNGVRNGYPDIVRIYKGEVVKIVFSVEPGTKYGEFSLSNEYNQQISAKGNNHVIANWDTYSIPKVKSIETGFVCNPPNGAAYNDYFIRASSENKGLVSYKIFVVSNQPKTATRVVPVKSYQGLYREQNTQTSEWYDAIRYFNFKELTNEQ